MAAQAIPGFSGVIFDMDGLVLNTEPTYAYAWMQAASAFGAQIDDEFCARLSGCHADEVESAFARAIGQGYDREKFLDLANQKWREHVKCQGIAKMPGFDVLLAVLKKHRIPYALATNSDGYYAKECMHFAGVNGYFDIVVTRDQVKHGKPAADLFIEAAKRLSLKPSSCLVLEDSQTGLLAAKAAGTIPVLVSNQADKGLKGLANSSFPSLTEVAALIDELYG